MGPRRDQFHHFSNKWTSRGTFSTLRWTLGQQTTSVQNPRDDFEANAVGTFNVLEAARLSNRKPITFNQGSGESIIINILSQYNKKFAYLVY